MIHTAQQLKALVRNLSKEDSSKGQIILRNYVAERFLERVSLSRFRSNLILKGGMLIASIIGLDKRSTMDIDTTIQNAPISEDDVAAMVEEICTIHIDDGIKFSITSTKSIMAEMDYPGIRVFLEAILDKTRIPLKLDFSTDDVITPHAIEYPYSLLFEDRSIDVLAYNNETILAEKMQTIIARGITNTRMRDFYDIYALLSLLGGSINWNVLGTAFRNTCHKRNTDVSLGNLEMTLIEIQEDKELEESWSRYQKKNDYAHDVSWGIAQKALTTTFNNIDN